MNQTWTVLCPGPGLSVLTPQSFKPSGPVVAVNVAVFAPLPMDFWSALDPPVKFEQVWGELSPAERRQLPVMWCRQNQVDNWQRIGVRTWHHPDLEKDFIAQNMPRLKGGKALTPMLHLSVLSTVTRCIGLGATRIEIWGADMQSSGYAYGQDTTGRTKQVWSQRWKTEPQSWSKAYRSWKEYGVEVVRLHHDPQRGVVPHEEQF